MALVGRSAELGELAALLDRTAAGFGGVITLAGPGVPVTARHPPGSAGRMTR